jgi:hypothetical protein
VDVMAAFFPKPGIARVGVNTTFTSSTASQATAAFGAQTFIIRVSTGAQPIYLKIGDGTPTAAATDLVFPAQFTEYFVVSPGQRAAVLQQGGSTGPVSITECS